MRNATCQILDALAHVTPDGHWFSTTLDASENALLRQMDEAGIAQAAMVGLADYIPNAFVTDVCRRHADRLIPVASFNPAGCSTTAETARQARQRLAGQGFAGVKLHPRLNRYDPLDPRVLALLDEIASWASPLPIWLCTYFYYQGGSLKKPAVEAIFELVSSHPTVPFILAHAAGPDILRLAHVVRHCPNAYLDLSFTLSRFLGSSVETDIRFLLRTFERRLLFGSDFPEISQAQALADLEGLLPETKPESSEHVLGTNLRNLVRGPAY